jgi:hypothetical protein
LIGGKRVAGDKRFREAARYQRAAIEQYLATLPTAAPLHAVAGGREVKTTIDQFEAADADALAAQERYRKWGLRGLTATTCGVLIGALLLMPFDAWFNVQWRIAVGALQTLMLLITFGAALLIQLHRVFVWVLFGEREVKWRAANGVCEPDSCLRSDMKAVSPPCVAAVKDGAQRHRRLVLDGCKHGGTIEPAWGEGLRVPVACWSIF